MSKVRLADFAAWAPEFRVKAGGVQLGTVRLQRQGLGLGQVSALGVRRPCFEHTLKLRHVPSAFATGLGTADVPTCSDPAGWELDVAAHMEVAAS